MNWSIPRYDDHTSGHTGITAPQLALFFIWSVALVLWVWKYPNRHRKNNTSSPQDTSDKVAVPVDAENGDKSKPEIGNSVSTEAQSQTATSTAVSDTNVKATKQFTQIKPPPDLCDFLGALLQFGCIMFFFFLTDYIKIFPKGERIYTRDTFLFLVFLLFLVAGAFTLKKTPDKILNRDQTEEWKGWMQVMFVWYHFFAAKEWYNWIRIYIAAYVWMTGFGNFSFFWVRKDYTIWRALKMLFRLNFLVLVLCAAVSNEFMLYYICPMHTYWFLSVYAMMGIARSWNETRWGMVAKFSIYAAINFIIFDIPGVAEKVFSPFWFVLGFNNGKQGIMHEWAFRLRLDHWVCFIGMICAYNYPHYETLITKIESYSSSLGNRRRELLLKLALCLPCAVVFIVWMNTILPLDKFTYNLYHPYLSFIPVLTFIVVRNIFPVLRVYYMDMFAWLGKITLETYLSQLHVYLQSNAKDRITYIDGYPFLNFSLNTIVYLAISHSLFSLTTDLSAYLLPKDTKQLVRSIIRTIGILIVAFASGFFFKYAILAV